MSLSELDDDVRVALEAERERPSPLDDAAKRRVTARLVGSLGGLAGTLALASALGAGAGAGAAAKVGGSIASGASRAVAAKLAALVLVAFGAGAGVHAAYTAASARSPSDARPPNVTVPGNRAHGSGSSEAPSAPLLPVVPVVSVDALPEAPKVAPPPSRAPGAPELRLRERALLEAAQSALARGNADEALEAAKRHASEFPKSELGEEREAIRTRALAMAGRCDEARAAVARFVLAYPSSLQRASLERLCRERTP